MNYLYIISLVAITIVSLSLCATKTSYAETVINSISVEAHSGGNTAKNGETVIGTTESSVDITTIVDGEVLEDIHETSTKGYVYVEHTVVANDSKTITTTNIDTEEPEPYAAPLILEPSVAQIVVESQTSRLDDTATTNASSATIISIQTADTASIAMSEANIEHPSLFVRFFSAVSKTLAYVLSNIFS
jgi:hypothetical protein